MSKHTPGPWRVAKEFAGPIPHYFVEGPQGFVVAEVYRSEADAHVTAAAPQLLDVVKLSRQLIAALVPVFEHIEQRDLTDKIHEVLKVIDLVVAKAEGE